MMDRKICILLIAIAALGLGCNAVAAEKGNLDEFKAVTPVPGGIELIFKDQGGRFNYQIGDSERKVGTYGERVELQNNQTAEFVTKGLKISLVPVPGNPGSFIVTKELDLRSARGNLTKETFRIDLEAGAVVYGYTTITE